MKSPFACTRVAFASVMICLLAWSAAAQSDTTNEKPKPEAKPGETQPTTKPPASVKQDPGILRFYLMDGTVITGKLQTQKLPIKTAFGDLVVPLTSIRNLKPGLDTHSKVDQRIQQLITDLSHANAQRRDEAQEELVAFGPALIPELRRHADSDDAERQVRIENIMETLYSMNEDVFGTESSPSVSLERLDMIETEHFTIAGQIQIDRFTVQSKFGSLEVRLADIKAAEQLTTEEPEVRRSLEVSGMDMTCRGYKSTAIKLKRGDKIIISAEGKITMSPWGNNSVSSPDGIAQNGMYSGKIPLGALAGRIGEDGKEFLVGSKLTITADKPGILYLGFAMQPNWANYQFPGSYEARIRVIPSP